MPKTTNVTSLEMFKMNEEKNMLDFLVSNFPINKKALKTITDSFDHKTLIEQSLCRERFFLQLFPAVSKYF